MWQSASKSRSQETERRAPHVLPNQQPLAGFKPCRDTFQVLQDAKYGH